MNRFRTYVNSGKSRALELAGRAARSGDSGQLAKLEAELAGVRRSYDRVSLERRSQPPWMRYLSRNAVFSRAMESFDTTRIGLVIAHDGPSLPAAVALASRTGAKLIFDAVDVPDLSQRSSASYQGFDADPHGVAAVGAYERSLIDQASAIVTVSEGVRTWLRARHPHHRIEVIRNFRSVADRKHHTTTAPSLRVLGEGTYIVLPNASYPGTGAELAIDALALLPTPFKLVIAGQVRPKDYHVQLEAHATAKGVADRLHLSGPVDPDGVIAQLATADIALLSLEPKIVNMRHALPNRLFESIDAGLPVVTGPLPDVAELVASHQIGATYETHLASDVAAAIEQVAATDFGEALISAQGALQWEDEAHVLGALIEARPNQDRCVIIANKLLEKNRRVPRLATTIAEHGFDVDIVARQASHHSLRVNNATYWINDEGRLSQV